MTTLGAAVTRTKRLLHSNTRTELDAVLAGKLNSGAASAAGATATDTIIQLSHNSDGIRAGSYISVGDNTQGYETMYVHRRAGEYATVERGMDGSTALGFTQGTIIEVEPRFTGHQILEALRDAIKALPNNLFAVATLEATFSTSEKSVTITPTNGFTQVLSATRTARSGDDRALNFNVTVQQYGATYELIRREALEKAVTVSLTYAHPFVTRPSDVELAVGDDLVGTAKMGHSMLDIPALGAAASLVLGEESLRLDLHSQGDSRSDAAVAAGDRARHSMLLQAQYDRRVSQEARRLMSKYGIRSGASASSVFPTTLR
jgi:hypothetical protein